MARVVVYVTRFWKTDGIIETVLCGNDDSGNSTVRYVRNGNEGIVSVGRCDMFYTLVEAERDVTHRKEDENRRLTKAGKPCKARVTKRISLLQENDGVQSSFS